MLLIFKFFAVIWDPRFSWIFAVDQAPAKCKAKAEAKPYNFSNKGDFDQQAIALFIRSEC